METTTLTAMQFKVNKAMNPTRYEYRSSCYVSGFDVTYYYDHVDNCMIKVGILRK